MDAAEMRRRGDEAARVLFAQLVTAQSLHHWRRFELTHGRTRSGTRRELEALYREHRADPNVAAEIAGPVTIRVMSAGDAALAVVWDGVHRWRAARQAGATRVPAEVYRVARDGRQIDHRAVVLGMVG